ncbi:integrase core domain-containing protein [Limosilactobacillus fermentum]|uniref:integrase core domain-containing protein n=1 Tax=Limosilactobacillus fermentum TaxID=1613 RepID=UPI003BB13B8D
MILQFTSLIILNQSLYLTCTLFILGPGNACIESFHALIKREWINRFKIHSYSEAKRLVFQYIETFYNIVRIHSHCGFKSPKQLEDEYQTQIQNLVVA